METIQEWIDRLVLEKYIGPQEKPLVKALRTLYNNWSI